MTEREQRGVLEMVSDFQPDRYGYRDAHGLIHLDPVACLLVLRGYQYRIDAAGKILFEPRDLFCAEAGRMFSPGKQAQDDINEWLHIPGDDGHERLANYLTLLLNLQARIFQRISPPIPDEDFSSCRQEIPRWSSLRRLISDHEESPR